MSKLHRLECFGVAPAKVAQTLCQPATERGSIRTREGVRFRGAHEWNLIGRNVGMSPKR